MFSIKCFCKYDISKIVRPLLAALSVNGLKNIFHKTGLSPEWLNQIWHNITFLIFPKRFPSRALTLKNIFHKTGLSPEWLNQIWHNITFLIFPKRFPSRALTLKNIFHKTGLSPERLNQIWQNSTSIYPLEASGPWTPIGTTRRPLEFHQLLL